jgi:hypothetical protein
MHFSTNFWRKTHSNRELAKCPGRGAAAPWRRTRRPASASAPRAARDRSPAEACPFPMRRTPRLLGVLTGPRALRRTIPARSSTQTTGPSAASRRTRAGRGRHTTAESLSSPQRHRWGLPYKTERLAPPRADTAAHRATRAAAGVPPPPVIPVANPRLQRIL